MRPKFVVVCVLVLLASAAIVLFKSRPNSDGSHRVPSPQAVSVVTLAQTEAISTVSIMQVARPVMPDLTQEQVDAEKERLYQWSMSDNASALSNILADITSPNREIRDAAIDATREFHSTNAIPYLKAAAANTDDTAEQIALLQAAEFLSVPAMDHEAAPVTPEAAEAARQKRAAWRAHMQAAGNTPTQNVQPKQDTSGQTPHGD